MKPKWLSILIFFVVHFSIAPGQVLAQTDQSSKYLDISGQWIGTVTQHEGGFRSVYEIQMFFEQDKDSIKGHSYVSIKDVGIFVDMEIRGSLHSGLLIRLEDIRKIDYKVKEGVEWCDKRYQLVIKREGDELLIEGYWQGETTFSSCVPGRIYLRKFSPRA